MNDTTQSRKPVGLIGMEPTTDYDSYDAVPWFRKQWFALFPLCAPAMVLIVLTGDVFAKPNKQMRRYSEATVWRYTAGARVFLIVCAIVAAVLLAVGLR